MPLYDSLDDVLETEKVRELMENGTIEIAPLAYMRGRTLNDSFVILDEAQNSTNEQMKMFLTRLGFNSKMVITGDVTQIDLDNTKKSGLIQAQSLLKNINGIRFANFSEKDVIRHDLVKQIIKAYSQNGLGK
jgi:phosphate starvation-inducible PhoH-like protein